MSKVKLHNLNNRAFSLIELLAAIILLGFLSALAVAGVSKLLANARVRHYSTQEKSIVMASQAYLLDKKNLYPKEIGSSVVIELKDLQESKVIGEVLDYNKEECVSDDSYVKVTKYSKDKYSYQVYLSCPNYSTSTGDSSNFVGPNIKFDFSHLIDDYNVDVDIEDVDKILDYDYVVYSGIDNNKNVIFTGNKTNKLLNEKLQEKLNLADYLPDSFSIVFKARDIYGNESVASIDKKISDITPPTCGEVKLDDTVMNYDNVSKKWLNNDTGLENWSNGNNRKVSVSCIDYESGCKQDTYEMIITDEMDVSFINIENNEGMKSNCAVPVNIDRTAPKINSIYNPYEGVWTNKSYGITINGSDENSGISYYAYSYKDSTRQDEKEWHIYEESNKNKFTTPEFSEERNMKVSFMVCDKAGNCSEGSTDSHIKIDKTAPVLTEVSNPYEDVWTNKSYSINLKGSDVEPQYGDGNVKYEGEKIRSGIGRYEYNYPETENTWLKYKNSGNKDYFTPEFSNDRNEVINFRVCDKAGNCSDKYPSMIKIDKIAPICNVSGGSSNWVNSNSDTKYRIIKATCSDTLGIDNSGCAIDSFEKEYNYDIDTDKAGAEGVEAGGFVTDIAGNKTECAANQVVKIDTTLPTCGKAKGSSKKWTRSNRTIKQECKDNLSGCTKSTYNKKYDKGKTTKDTIEIIDKAGNSNLCLYNVYVNKNKNN